MVRVRLPCWPTACKRIVDDLYADLEQLVGISADEQQVVREFRADFNFKSLPLRLREFDGGAQQSVEIDGGHRGRALFGETEQTGDQRPGAPGMLPDSPRQFALFRSERRAQEQIGITQHGGDGIVEFVGCAAQQLADGGEFFGLRDLCLQTFQVGEGLARVSQQAEQFPVEQALPHEDHGAHENCRGQSQDHAERTDASGNCVIQQRPCGKERERKGSDHAQPGEPHAMYVEVERTPA